MITGSNLDRAAEIIRLDGDLDKTNEQVRGLQAVLGGIEDGRQILSTWM